MKDLIITWPKKRSLDSYIEELDKADKKSDVICFKIPTRPKEECERCYVVHDGRVRGYNAVVGCSEFSDRQVIDPITNEYWPKGIYIVRDALWHPLKAGPEMKGFQGYRYIERPCDVCEGNKDLWVNWSPTPVTCGYCNGSGKVS